MKAKKLLTLLPVLALAACGGAKSLDQAQATERANAILAAQGEITETPCAYQVVEHLFYQDTYADGTVEEQEMTNSEEIKARISVTVEYSLIKLFFLVSNNISTELTHLP